MRRPQVANADSTWEDGCVAVCVEPVIAHRLPGEAENPAAASGSGVFHLTFPRDQLKRIRYENAKSDFKSKVTLAPNFILSDANACPAGVRSIPADDSAAKTDDQRPPKFSSQHVESELPGLLPNNQSRHALCAIKRARCNYFREFSVKSLKLCLNRAESAERQ